MTADGMLGALRHALRRWRVDRLALGALAVTVAMTAGLAAAVPRLATRTADAALRAEAAGSDTAQRTVQIASSRFVPEASEGFIDDEVAHAAELRERVPAAIRSILGASIVTADLQRFVIGPDAGRPAAGAFLTVRGQPALADQVRIVEGRAPTGAHFGKVTDEQRPVTVEIGLGTATADALSLGVGDRFSVAVDPTAGPTFGDETVVITLEVVGLFEALDPAAPVWAAAPQLLSPSTFDLGETQVIFATVAAGSDGLAALASTFLRVTTTSVAPLAVDDLVARDAPRLLRAFEELPIGFRGTGGGLEETVTARSGFDGVLERFIETEAATGRLMSVAFASLAGVALLAIILLAVMLAVRRRAATMLDRQRGASALQVVAPAAAEAILLAGLGSLAGLLVARAVLPGGDDAPSLAAAGGVGAVSAIVIVAAAAASLGGTRRRQTEHESAVEQPSRRRLVGELAVVLVAALGIYLLRSRGLAGAVNQGIDPFLASVPLLATLGMGLVLLRAYPYPLLALAAATGRGRGFTTTFGLRRAGTGQSQRLPIVALLLATALGVFGVTLAVSIGNGQAIAALEQVGADYRVEAVTGPNPSRLGLADIPGIDATAAAWVARDIPVITSTRRGGADARLVAIDVAGFEAVSRAPLPAELHAPADDGAPLPAVISANLGPGSPIEAGDTFSLVIGGGRVEMLAVATRGSFPAVAPGERFVVTSLAAMEARLERTLAPTQLLARGADGLAGAIRDRALAQGAVSVVIARDETLAGVREAPFSVAVVSGYTLSLLVAAAYVIVAVVIGLLLGRQARERDLAHLRTMGLSRRDTMALVALEQIPMPLVGVAAGTGLGLLLVALIGPGLDLAAFTGTQQPIPLSVPWPLLAALGVTFAALMLLITLVASLSARAVDPALTLRLGDT